jgi:glycosyl transferase family 25
MLKRTIHGLREYLRFRAGRSGDRVEHAGAPPVLYINLDRSVERRSYIEGHLRALGLSAHRIEAVDGRVLADDEGAVRTWYDDQVARDSFSRSLSLPEIGCARSHVRAYEYVREHELEMALIIEDDARLEPEVAVKLEAVLAEIPEDWGVVQLRYDVSAYEPLGEHSVQFNVDEQLPVAATAYLVNGKAIDAILEKAFPLRYPADSFVGRLPRWGVKVYGTRPQLAGINNIFPSAIQGRRNLKFALSNAVKSVILKVFR